MNIRLSKHAPAPIWCRGPWHTKWKINLTCTDPITMFCGTTILHVPMAPQMFSTPGTVRCSVPLALLQCSLHSFLLQLQWIFGTTSHHRLPVCPWMELELPSLLWGSFHSPHSPWEWSGLWQYRSQCPLMVTTQSPPTQIVTALMVYAMASCTVPDVGLSSSLWISYCLQVFFHRKKSFLYDFCHWLPAGWPTCASWWCCLSWGWLAMSPSSSALHWYV